MKNQLAQTKLYSAQGADDLVSAYIAPPSKRTLVETYMEARWIFIENPQSWRNTYYVLLRGSHIVRLHRINNECFSSSVGAPTICDVSKVFRCQTSGPPVWMSSARRGESIQEDQKCIILAFFPHGECRGNRLRHPQEPSFGHRGSETATNGSGSFVPHSRRALSLRARGERARPWMGAFVAQVTLQLLAGRFRHPSRG